MEQKSIVHPAWGLVLGLGLILFVVFTGGGFSKPELTALFTPDPNAPTAAPFQLPSLPVPDVLKNALAKLPKPGGGSSSQPATAPAGGKHILEVSVSTVTKESDHIQIKGGATNTSNSGIQISSDSIKFKDSKGVSYSMPIIKPVDVGPGQTAPLDLGVPIPPDATATMIVVSSDGTYEIPLNP